MAADPNVRLAVLIDADNAPAAIAAGLLSEVATYGTAHVKRAYGDWTGTALRSWKEVLLSLSIQPMQQFAYTSGKNATDAAMIIDAMDLLYTGRFDGFCLVSSDSDFTRLAGRIRESGLIVYGFGERKTPTPFVAACDKFVYLENLDAHQGATTVEVPPKVQQPLSAPRLKADTSLVQLLRRAVEATSDDEGWSDLASVGHILTKQRPDFDSRTYGYGKLSELVRATTLFKLERRSSGTGKPAVLYAQDARRRPAPEKKEPTLGPREAPDLAADV